MTKKSHKNEEINNKKDMNPWIRLKNDKKIVQKRRKEANNRIHHQH